MPDALPSVARYLDSLPAGIRSYPDCLVKAAVLRNEADPKPLGPEVPLPPEVRALVDHPPPVTVWVPEVHYTVSVLATREVHFPGADTGAFAAWMHERNVRLLRTPLYRALFFVLSPERLLAGVAQRWSMFRRGTELRLASSGEGRAELVLRTPPHLYPPIQAVAAAAAFAAALEAVGARRVRVDGDLRGPTEVVFRGTWG